MLQFSNVSEHMGAKLYSIYGDECIQKENWRSALRDIASLLVTVSKHVNFNIASRIFIKRGFTYVHKGGINVVLIQFREKFFSSSGSEMWQ